LEIYVYYWSLSCGELKAYRKNWETEDGLLRGRPLNLTNVLAGRIRILTDQNITSDINAI